MAEITKTTIKGQLLQKTGASTANLMHPESEADLILYSNTIGGTAVTNVDDALDALVTLGGGVTGVKGNSETNYRTGNVNLTAANIGAEAAFTDGSATIASLASDIVTIKAGVSQSSGAIGNSTGDDIVLAKVAHTGAFGDLSGTANILQQTLLTTKGDIIYASAGNTAARLGIGSNGQVLATNSSGVPEWKSLGTASMKGVATTISSSSTDNDLATAKAVWDAIDALPQSMVFKGSVGTGGTIEWSALPTPSSSNSGWTYAVITKHTTAPVCEVGDLIVSNGTTWVVIPSGDEPTGTVTSVGLDTTSNAGLEVSGSPITSSGTITINLQTAYGDKKNPYGSKTKNYVLAAPSSADGVPSFRALVSSDIPALDYLTGATMDGTSIVSSKIAALATINGNYNASSNKLATASDLPTSFNLVDDILDGSANKYAPYASGDKAAGRLYSGTTAPTNTTRLNYDGYFYATKLYSGGNEVLTNNKTITLSGDATGSGTTAITVTLAASGVAAGTYSAVTVDTKGRVTAGGQMVEVINNAATPSVVTGGWYFEKVASA